MSAVDIQRIGAAICVTAGVAFLAGYGWALLTLGVLLWLSSLRFRLPARELITSTSMRFRHRWQAVSGSVQARGKAMGGLGLIGLIVGFAGAIGFWWGILAGGVVLAATSLYIDRQA